MNLRSPYRVVSLILLAVISASLAGCGLVIKQRANSERERIASETQLAVASSRELDPIRGKVWMHGLDKEPPLSLLVLSEKATDAEKPAIAKWHEIVAANKNKAVAFAQKYYPLQAGMVETSYANLLSLIAELYSQNLSYGEYNKKVKDINTAFVKQASDMRLQQSLIQQLRPPPSPPPKTSFSCYTIGHQTHCN